MILCQVKKKAMQDEKKQMAKMEGKGFIGN